MKEALFPFAAVVGQDNIKNALLWNMVNPRIGGVLISGDKGTAKSTLVRSISLLLDDMDIVEVPLNITEDRLCGSVNFEHAINKGEKTLEPGLLKKAHGNLIYVDEINLLSDHILKILLESVSSGMNKIERDGISCQHVAEFFLIGSMNPEEGSLSSQFMDRFGLYVEVEGEQNIQKRSEIMKRRLAYENSPSEFLKKWQNETRKIYNSIQRAKENLSKITVTSNALQAASSIATTGNCAGHRGELTIIETAKAIAALDGRVALNISDIKEAAQYALPHRVRQTEDIPPKNTSDDQNEQEQEQDQEKEDNQNQPNNNPPPNNHPQNGDDQDNNQQEMLDNDTDEENTDPAEDEYETKKEDEPSDQKVDGDREMWEMPGESFPVSQWLTESSNKTVNRGNGKRSVVKTSMLQGRYVRYRYPLNEKVQDIALDATLRAAAPYQRHRQKNGVAVAVEKSDIRSKVREKRTGNHILFVVDASGSMGANKRMKAVKGAIMSLLTDAYQKRDKVGMVAFKNRSAEVVLDITRSVELAKKKLTDIRTKGRTPLAAGLELAHEVIHTNQIKDKDILPVIVLVSDGWATYGEGASDPFQAALNAAYHISEQKIKTVVIDTNCNFIKLGLAEKIAEALEADYFKVDDLQAQNVVQAVQMTL